MGPRQFIWHRLSISNVELALACSVLTNVGCSGGVIDHQGTGGSGVIVATGGMGVVGGGSGTACYSPQNPGNAYQSGAQGCTCNPASDASVCVQGVGFICMNSHWIAVADGPCMPMPGSGGSGAGGSGAGGSIGGSTSVSKACGARAGNSCLATEYCAYEAGEYCGQADAEAVCKARPQICDDIYAPVCGCDGKTYSSACVAAAAGTGVYTNGACAN